MLRYGAQIVIPDGIVFYAASRIILNIRFQLEQYLVLDIFNDRFAIANKIEAWFIGDQLNEILVVNNSPFSFDCFDDKPVLFRQIGKGLAIYDLQLESSEKNNKKQK